jgi:hypothetical protein
MGPGDEKATLGPFPDEIYMEMFYSGTSENADIKLWDAGEIARSDFIRTDKEGKTLVEGSVIFDKPYMYLTADGVCMKFDGAEPVEGGDTIDALEFYKSIYSPNIASKEQYEKEFSPCSSRIPECKEITITEETYNGLDAYLLTMKIITKIVDKEVEDVHKVWVDRKTSFPLRKEIINPDFGTTSTDYTRVEAMDIPPEIFNIPGDCDDFTIPEEDTSTVTDEPAKPEKATVPVYITGEFWVYNSVVDFTGKERATFLLLQEVIGEEVVDGIPAYVVQRTEGRAPQGNYYLAYLSKEDLNLIKFDAYEQDILVSSEVYTPSLPSYPFPFGVYDTLFFEGRGSSVGEFYGNAEVQSYEKRETPAGEFDTYKLKSFSSYSNFNIESLTYYSQEMKNTVYSKSTLSGAPGTPVIEIEEELVEHGLPPKEAPDIRN